MRKAVLIAALALVSASAQAGQSRNLSVAGADSRPIAAPLPPAPRIAEVPSTQPAPVVSAPAPAVAAPVTPAPAVAAPVTSAPETGAPPVAAAPVPPPLPPAATAAPAVAPAVDAPKYVERPTVAPATSDAKVDDGKPSRRAERRHHGGGYWTAGRIMGELRRYGISYGYGGW